MKILIDIGHPAHVHYFKHFIKMMKQKGHHLEVTARDKEIVHNLLNLYQISFKSRGKGAKSNLGKFFYLFYADFVILSIAKKFKPDLFLSFGSAYAAHASKLLGKPHISFEDTEHATLEHKLYIPFTDVIFTPATYKKDLGDKQIFFNGTTDLFYLHPNNFLPSESVHELLKIDKNDKFIIMRFVSWNANHDKGQSGLSLKEKIKSVEILSKYAKVFISAEGSLPKELQLYELDIPANRIHDVIYHAEIFVGESGTMSTESAILGTPSIIISTLAPSLGAFEDFIKLGWMNIFTDFTMAMDKAETILKTKNFKINSREQAKIFIKERMDLSAFLVWFIEDYPQSLSTLNSQPNYQNRF